MLKKEKIKKRNFGSEVTIYRRQKSNGLNILPTTDDQKPTSQMARVSNPGGAIFNMEEINKYIPLDKSWMMRMGILDLVNGYKNIINFLNKQENLSWDLEALKQAISDWDEKQVIDIGESGTLYRFLKFLSWKDGLNKEFIKHRTLKTRNMCDNPEIVDWPIEKLLTLDKGTSQWAGASVLTGNEEIIKNPPFHLQTTYDAVNHWKLQREKNLCWESKQDKTIRNQALAYVNLLKTNQINFIPQQPEDYCFARAFNIITFEEGAEKWPSLMGHESNRIEEMERELNNFENGIEIQSKDHRVVQSIAMLGKFKNKEVKFTSPECVNKTWPQFWNFIEDCN